MPAPAIPITKLTTDAAEEQRLLETLRSGWPVYRDLVREELPETEAAEDTSLILPLYPTMTEGEQDQVVERLSALVGVGI